MKRFLIMIIWLLCLGIADASPAKFAFVPGKSLGPVHLGQSLDAVLTSLRDWTCSEDREYEYAVGIYYIFPKKAPGVLVQFILGMDKKNILHDIEIHDASCFLEGHPEVHPGCTRKQVVAALGTRPDFQEFYCDYEDLGIRFLFEDGLPPRADDPHRVPKFAKGQCDCIQIYRPGSK